MSAREIPIAQWAEFLDQFSREHRAWLATVDRVRPGAPSHTEGVERPLAAVVAQMTAHRIARIEIRFQETSQAREPIEIEAPTSVRVEETSDGVTSGLEITDEGGECTRLRFRAAPRAEMLDGIAPGELPSS
jgi:hypothetical protein